MCSNPSRGITRTTQQRQSRWKSRVTCCRRILSRHQAALTTSKYPTFPCHRSQTLTRTRTRSHTQVRSPILRGTNPTTATLCPFPAHRYRCDLRKRTRIPIAQKTHHCITSPQTSTGQRKSLTRTRNQEQVRSVILPRDTNPTTVTFWITCLKRSSQVPQERSSQASHEQVRIPIPLRGTNPSTAPF